MISKQDVSHWQTVQKTSFTKKDDSYSAKISTAEPSTQYYKGSYEKNER